MEGNPPADRSSSFTQGARAASPLLLGVIPFGMICGAVCVDKGMPEWAALGLSTLVFAGASQLVATQLMAEQASVAVVILTGLVINMRMLMYSASLAPRFREESIFLRALLAYAMTDQAYAVSINRYSRQTLPAVDPAFFYLGAAAILWLSFNAATVAGAYLGALVPAEWNLDFAIPLTFMALVVPSLKDRPAVLAALAAGIAALATETLPLNLGLALSACLGIAVGYGIERRSRRG